MAGAGVIMTRPGPTLEARGERVVSHMRSDNDDDEMMMSLIIIV